MIWEFVLHLYLSYDSYYQPLTLFLTAFSQMPWFFIIKCWILWVLWLYICLIFSGITFWEKFANVLLIPLLMDSCENRSRFYWVLWPQSYSFFANDIVSACQRTSERKRLHGFCWHLVHTNNSFSADSYTLLSFLFLTAKIIKSFELTSKRQKNNWSLL